MGQGPEQPRRRRAPGRRSAHAGGPRAAPARGRGRPDSAAGTAGFHRVLLRHRRFRNGVPCRQHHGYNCGGSTQAR
eukprot:4206195-Pyramimonas_sp.AAC.1